MTPTFELLMSLMLLESEPPESDGRLTSDWLPGLLLVLVIFGVYGFWRYSKLRGRRKLP